MATPRQFPPAAPNPYSHPASNFGYPPPPVNYGALPSMMPYPYGPPPPMYGPPPIYGPPAGPPPMYGRPPTMPVAQLPPRLTPIACPAPPGRTTKSVSSSSESSSSYSDGSEREASPKAKRSRRRTRKAGRGRGGGNGGTTKLSDIGSDESGDEDAKALKRESRNDRKAPTVKARSSIERSRRSPSKERAKPAPSKGKEDESYSASTENKEKEEFEDLSHLNSRTMSEKITLDLGTEEPVEVNATLKTVFVDLEPELPKEAVRERENDEDSREKDRKEKESERRGGKRRERTPERKRRRQSKSPSLGKNDKAQLKTAEADYAKEKSVYEFAVSIWKEQVDKQELHDPTNPLYITMKNAYKRMKSTKEIVEKLRGKGARNSGDDRSARSRSDSPEKPKLQKYWSKSKGCYAFASLSRSPTRSPSPNSKKTSCDGPPKTKSDEFFYKVVQQLNHGPLAPPNRPPPSFPPPGFGFSPGVPPPGFPPTGIPPPGFGPYPIPPPIAGASALSNRPTASPAASGFSSNVATAPPVGVPPPNVANPVSVATKPATTKMAPISFSIAASSKSMMFHKGSDLTSVPNPLASALSAPDDEEDEDVSGPLTSTALTGNNAVAKPSVPISQNPVAATPLAPVIPASAAPKTIAPIVVTPPPKNQAKMEEAEKKLALIQETTKKQTKFLATRVYTTKVKMAIAKNAQLCELGIKKNEVYFLYFKPHLLSANSPSSLFLMMSEADRAKKVGDMVWAGADAIVEPGYTKEIVIEPDKEVVASNPFATWSHYQLRLETADDYGRAFRLANVFPIQWYDLSTILIHWPQIFKTGAEETDWVDGLKSVFSEMSCVGTSIQVSETAKKSKIASSRNPLIKVERLPFEVCMLVTFVFPETVDVLVNLRLEHKNVPLGFRRLRSSQDQYRLCAAEGLPLSVDLVQRESKVLENPPEIEDIEGPGMLTREFLGLPKFADDVEMNAALKAKDIRQVPDQLDQIQTERREGGSVGGDRGRGGGGRETAEGGKNVGRNGDEGGGGRPTRRDGDETGEGASREIKGGGTHAANVDVGTRGKWDGRSDDGGRNEGRDGRSDDGGSYVGGSGVWRAGSRSSLRDDDGGKEKGRRDGEKSGGKDELYGKEGEGDFLRGKKAPAGFPARSSSSSRSTAPLEDELRQASTSKAPSKPVAVGNGRNGGGGGSQRRAKFNDDDDEDEDHNSAASNAVSSASSGRKSDGTIKYLVASSTDKTSVDAEEVKKYFVNFGKVSWCTRSGVGNTAVAFSFEDPAVCKSVLQYGHRIKKRPIWLQGMGDDGKPIGKPTVAREMPQ